MTIKLVCVASPLSTQHYRVGNNLLVVMIMHIKGVTYASVSGC
jgi:hypothetical protein